MVVDRGYVGGAIGIDGGLYPVYYQILAAIGLRLQAYCGFYQSVQHSK
jgi:hypothetical protein